MNDAMPRSEIQRIDWDHLAYLVKLMGDGEMDENVDRYLVVRHKHESLRIGVNQHFEITLVETPIEESGKCENP